MRLLRGLDRLLAPFLMGGVRAYQLTLGHFMGGHCRFLPTCSHYAMEALRVHGGMRGGWLATKRVCRCHPWGGSGVDEVPGAPHTKR